MTPVSAHDVARVLRERLGNDLPTVAAHKLLFFAQAWHVAAFGEPLFREEVRAYPKGPLVFELWADEKHGRPRPAPCEVEDRGVIDLVVDVYGHESGAELRRATHDLACWRDARRAAGDDLAWLNTAADVDEWRSGSVPALPISHDAMAASIATTDAFADHLREVDRHRAVLTRQLEPIEENPLLRAAIEDILAT